ncbi:hypothetical protein LguiB_017682 [Lonicera macranthoides]
MINYPFGSDSPKSFHAHQRFEFDLESGTLKRPRKPQNSPFHPIKMLKSFRNRVQYYYKLHPIMISFTALSFGFTVLVIILVYKRYFHLMSNYREFGTNSDNYPFVDLRNLVMVATHSVYTSTSCEEVDKEDSWFLLSYQKHPGQAATFVEHIRGGVEIAAKDDEALLLFSGGETRKEAGPRSEAQSYWLVAESQGWFALKTVLVSAYQPFELFLSIKNPTNFAHYPIRPLSYPILHSYPTADMPNASLLSFCNQEKVRGRALTEEHARDSFENLLFSLCRFRELTGKYPHNITVSPSFLPAPNAATTGYIQQPANNTKVVGYDFKEDRFVNLHRTAITFPATRFFYLGTPATLTSREAALKGESMVRAQFQADPYGCVGSLRHKKLGRDPFHRTIPYPHGCPEIKGLFGYCQSGPYRGSLPWA